MAAVDSTIHSTDRWYPELNPWVDLMDRQDLFFEVLLCWPLLVNQTSISSVGSVAVFRTPSAPRRSHHDRENKAQPEAELAEEEKATVGDERNVTRW
jgi:hypothetical protein